MTLAPAPSGTLFKALHIEALHLTALSLSSSAPAPPRMHPVTGHYQSVMSPSKHAALEQVTSVTWSAIWDSQSTIPQNSGRSCLARRLRGSRKPGHQERQKDRQPHQILLQVTGPNSRIFCLPCRVQPHCSLPACWATALQP